MPAAAAHRAKSSSPGDGSPYQPRLRGHEDQLAWVATTTPGSRHRAGGTAAELPGSANKKAKNKTSASKPGLTSSLPQPAHTELSVAALQKAAQSDAESRRQHGLSTPATDDTASAACTVLTELTDVLVAPRKPGRPTESSVAAATLSTPGAPGARSNQRWPRPPKSIAGTDVTDATELLARCVFPPPPGPLHLPVRGSGEYPRSSQPTEALANTEFAAPAVPWRQLDRPLPKLIGSSQSRADLRGHHYTDPSPDLFRTTQQADPGHDPLDRMRFGLQINLGLVLDHFSLCC